MLEPWLRETGFIICYGAIVLKLYRHLVEFRTRKAHRYVVRDLDLLRYLCAMIVAVLCYLAAFTALCIDYLDYSELIWNVEMESITTSNMCKPLKWDYVSYFKPLYFFKYFIPQNAFFSILCTSTTGYTSWGNVDIDFWCPIGFRLS